MSGWYFLFSEIHPIGPWTPRGLFWGGFWSPLNHSSADQSIFALGRRSERTLFAEQVRVNTTDAAAQKNNDSSNKIKTTSITRHMMVSLGQLGLVVHAAALGTLWLLHGFFSGVPGTLGPFLGLSWADPVPPLALPGPLGFGPLDSGQVTWTSPCNEQDLMIRNSKTLRLMCRCCALLSPALYVI